MRAAMPASEVGAALSAPPAKTDLGNLSELIDVAERAVIERDRRVQHALHELSGRIHHKAGIGAGAGAAVAAAALAWRWLRRRRGGGGEARAGRGGGVGGLLSALSMLAALLPADLRRLIPHSPRHLLFGVLPALGQVVSRRRAHNDRAAEEAVPPPATAAVVDLERYCGRWFEIGRLPLASEKRWTGDVSLEYLPTATPGVLALVAHGRLRDGRLRRRRGVARVVDGESNARLQVSFAPASLRWLPTLWSDHWILHVAADYGCALVGTPDRRGLWLLARTPVLAAADIETMIDAARRQGYDTAAIDFTPQRRS